MINKIRALLAFPFTTVSCITAYLSILIEFGVDTATDYIYFLLEEDEEE